MRHAVLGLSLILSGCAAGMRSDIDVTYEGSAVKVERVALLPVTAGAGLEGFRRHIATMVEQDMAALHPHVEVVRAQESLEKLNNAGLALEYSEMLEAYGKTGILDKETLRRMGEALEVEHMLQLQATYDASEFVGYGAVSGNISREERQELHLFAHVWGASEGDVVWEAAGSVKSQTGEFTIARDVQEILAKGTRDLVVKLPTGVGGS